MKKILNSIAIILLMATAIACDNEPHFTVEGTVENAKDSMLYLEWVSLEGVQRLDSAKLKENGEFCLKGNVPPCPEFYALRIGNRHINFSIDSTETVTITTSLPKFENDYTVEGNESSKKIQEICKLQSEFQAQIVAVEKNSSLYPGEIVDSVNAMVEAYKQKMKNDYIFVAPMSAYAYYAVCQSVSDVSGLYQLFNPLNNRDDVKCYAAVATAWDGYYPDAPRTEQICNMAIQGMERTAPPTEKVLELNDSLVSETGIIDLKLPDINGKVRTLSELKGKVVLLDFTIYNAKESPERNRIMRELYDKYHDKGLEIYQVSVDQDTHFWKYSCENLPWICVHDANAQAANTYRVADLPTSFIINRDNDLELRSDMIKTSLESEIQKLL